MTAPRPRSAAANSVKGPRVEKQRKWRASWIWPAGCRFRPNVYAAFRRRIRLAAVPRRARVHISAFTHYRLFVNGCEVGFGPNPADPRWYYFDSYDVTGLLRRGANVLAVLAYNIGESRWCDLACAAGVGGAMIAELVTEGPERVVATDGRWRAARAPAWRQRTSPFTELRAAFKEYVDGRKGVLDFTRLDFKDSTWGPAEVLGPHPMPPFERLIPREIPHFKAERVSPANATAIGFNYAYGFSEQRGWEITETSALIGGYKKESDHLMLLGGEGVPITAARRKAFAARCCEVRSLRRGEHPSILVDFGRLCVGRPLVRLGRAPAGARIDIAYGENLNLTYIDRYTCREGPQEFRPYHRRAARYMLLTFRGAVEPVVLEEVAFDDMRPDLPVKGVFEADESRAEEIFRVAARTVAASMQDHYEDSVWREQKLMVGDMRIQALAAYYTLGAYRYTRKCILQMARIVGDDGWLPPGGPAGGRDAGIIIEFPAHYVATVRDYLAYSGDFELAREVYPVVAGQLANYERMEHTRGLIDIGYSPSMKWWCFIDWSEIDKRGVVAPLGMIVLDAFDAGAELARALGREGDAHRFARRAAHYRARIDEVFWDPRRRLYRDAVVHGRPSEHASVETNALALLTGVARAGRRRALVERFARRRWHAKSPFFETFVVEALMRRAAPKVAWDYMLEYWGAMVERGADTFWEAFDLDAFADAPRALPRKEWSMCHGWSAGPAYLIGSYLMGISPGSGGFERVKLAPRPSSLARFSGAVPTPAGVIRVECDERKGTLELRAPEGIRFDPDGRWCRRFRKITVNGRRL